MTEVSHLHISNKIYYKGKTRKNKNRDKMIKDKIIISLRLLFWDADP